MAAFEVFRTILSHSILCTPIAPFLVVSINAFDIAQLSAAICALLVSASISSPWILSRFSEPLLVFINTDLQMKFVAVILALLVRNFAFDKFFNPLTLILPFVVFTDRLPSKSSGTSTTILLGP